MAHLTSGKNSTRVALLFFGAVAVLVGGLFRAQTAAHSQTLAEAVEIDANAPSHAFPHFWEKMFGSERGIVTLRESYRNDLRETRVARQLLQRRQQAQPSTDCFRHEPGHNRRY